MAHSNTQVFWKLSLVILLALIATVTSQLNIALGQVATDATSTMTSTKFYYPLGLDSWRKTGGTWLGRDAAHDLDGPPAYIDTFYHLGVDMPANVGDPVYAITNGTVWNISQNGWGDGNVAVIIKHTLNTGAEFLSVYGHIRPTNGLKIGDRVAGGVKLATVGPWDGGNHLHFGVHPAIGFPLIISGTIGWGMAKNSYWPDPNGMVDPVNWITSNTPKCGNATSERFRPSGAIPQHPNGSLIKSGGSDIVYLLQSGKKRPIPTPQRLYELYGPGRGFDFRDVVTVSDAEFGKYTVGDVVNSALAISPLPNGSAREPDGRLIIRRSGGEISIVSEGRRRAFSTWVAFVSLGYLPCNLAVVDNYDDYPQGPTVEATMTGSITDGELADLSPPILSITSHIDEQHVSTSSITISGTATDASTGGHGISQILVNGSRANNDTASGAGTANWSAVVALNAGPNSIVVTAKDDSALKNATTNTRTMFRDTQPPPTPIPTPTFRITGRVVDINGVPQTGVEVDYGGYRRLADGNLLILRPDFVFTDNQGFYSINPAYGGFHYNVFPYQLSGRFFNPRRITLDNLNSDQTFNFVAKDSPSPAPIIKTEPSSDVAIALESVSQQRDPFPKLTNNLDSDSRTRASIFVANLDLPDGEFLSDGDLFVNAESVSDHTSYGTTVESVSSVADLTFFHQVVIKLPDDPGVIGDFLLKLHFLGASSNSARITIFPIGLQFLAFMEGDPKQPGDGVTVATSTSSYSFVEPLALRGTRDGFTFTFYLPSGSPELKSMSFNVISLKPPGPCRASFGISGNSLAGRVSMNGVSGSYINATQGDVEGMVRAANLLYPGCDFSIHDLFLGGIYLNGTNQTIMNVDAISLGRGQNLFSGSLSSSRP